MKETEDTYSTVILKEVSAFQWIQDSYDAHRTTSKLKWVIKMDDDVIINPSNLQKVLLQFQDDVKHKTILCRKAVQKPHRNPSSKW